MILVDANILVDTIGTDDKHVNKYIYGGIMQVSKWGNSLAIRLPAVVVKALKLREGRGQVNRC